MYPYCTEAKDNDNIILQIDAVHLTFYVLTYDILLEKLRLPAVFQARAGPDSQIRGNIMSNKEAVENMTGIMAAFIEYAAKHLPDDVYARLRELQAEEDNPLAREIYDLMFRNLDLAVELDRPTCQDTGFMQFWIKCGSGFPLIAELEELLTEALRRATAKAPLRFNVVETFDEENTGTNTGTGAPTFWWDIIPGWDGCEIYTYNAGGGCSLPGHAMVLMPGQGYEAVVEFVMERMTSYGLNACPPLYVGVGIGTSVETAALNAKHALMRPIGTHNENEKAALLEKLLEDGINEIGFGPQGMGGKHSVLGVNVENTARHPACMGVAVAVSCWVHRRGHLVFDRDLNCEVSTHSGFAYEGVTGNSGDSSDAPACTDSGTKGGRE